MIKNVVIIILSLAVAGFTVFTVAVYQSRQEDPWFTTGTVFPVRPLPLKLDTLPWKLLATDKAGDQLPGHVDGESVSYYLDSAGDSLWFKIKQYNSISPNYPSLSLAIDSDLDQATGKAWYGTDKTLTYDVLVLLGAKRKGQKFTGYNRIGDANGTVTFYFDVYRDTYFLGVAIKDLHLTGTTLNFIPSVGANAIRSDDLIDKGFLSIELKP